MDDDRSLNVAVSIVAERVGFRKSQKLAIAFMVSQTQDYCVGVSDYCVTGKNRTRKHPLGLQAAQGIGCLYRYS
jgi:hypothetical protein